MKSRGCAGRVFVRWNSEGSDMIVCGQEKTEGREEMRMKRGNWTLRDHGAMVIRTVSSL